MKRIFFLIIIILISNSLIANDLNYHFLDSNHVEVFLKNPDKISYKERKKIYFYVEYKVNSDNYIDKFKVYFADGCLPSFEKNKIIKNKRPYLSFTSPDSRIGLLASEYEIMWKKKPLSFICNNSENNDTTCFTKINRTDYYPNGQATSQEFEYFSYYSKRKNKDSFYQKVKSNQVIYYNSDGSKDFTANYKNGDMFQAIQDFNNGSERVMNYDSGVITNVKDFKNGKNTAIYYYTDGEFDKSRTEKFSLNGAKLFNKTFNEENIKEYLDSRNDLEPLEGLFTVNSKKNGQLTYKIAVLQDEDGKLKGHQITGYMYNAKAWKAGDIRATFEEIAVDNFYKVMWLSDYKNQEVNDVIQDETRGALLTFGNYNMVKLYPKFSSRESNNINKSEDWKGNGSGLVISKSGYIVTNYHVIEGSSEIEVEFKYQKDIVSFKARIVQQDVLNDLAIIKIEDNKFSSFLSIPYGYKARNVDVGTRIYAYGYPKALAGMGKEVKVTDGIISSKTGYQGDITKYQISAAIQGGNSGGPLFDSNANLIGINVAKLQSKDIDNVAYSIKTNYLLNLIDVLPENINLTKTSQLSNEPLVDQIKIISDYVVLIKIK